jgi:predicted PhzF superfamily epimerase YddE/YHI9
MINSYPYYQIDAFMQVRLGGNACAVFLDADNMEDTTMLAVAREVYLMLSSP